ncbi:hypothetical protein FSARC_3156 [Fusarium sarcochroum]|uniref:CN hydrolase domain-containing protein n=1 Tax=Fusarium sarcochroum TaxID=1208366 RepID=A0A8H4U4J1_9HYPO|nr:hypothetical protein FSARC_3156 [Fusarium sarcochroum]
MAEKGKKTIRLAAVQASPVLLDKTATTQKVCALIIEAGQHGADVIGFPETFIAGYPGWVEIIPVRAEPAKSLYRRLFAQAVEMPGPETSAIGAACEKAGIYAVVGINERRSYTTGTLWNTNLFFGRDGTLLHKHRKFTPTVGERLIHAPGDTGSKTSVRAEFGTISSLICGENGNPLAQYSIALEYPIVHVASWPPHHNQGQNVEKTVQVFSAAVATSVGCYVINSIAVMDENAISAYALDEESRKFLQDVPSKRQASIVGPGGTVLADAQCTAKDGSEDIIYADVNTEDLVAVKYAVDFAGHYNRPEVFAHHFRPFLVKE